MRCVLGFGDAGIWLSGLLLSAVCLCTCSTSPPVDRLACLFSATLQGLSADRIIFLSWFGGLHLQVRQFAYHGAGFSSSSLTEAMMRLRFAVTDLHWVLRRGTFTVAVIVSESLSFGLCACRSSLDHLGSSIPFLVCLALG